MYSLNVKNDFGNEKDECSSIHTIDMLWRVRPSIRFCFLSCDVRSKGEAFPSKRFGLKKITLCNQKHRLFFYLLGKCFALTSVGRITREPRTKATGCE